MSRCPAEPDCGDRVTDAHIAALAGEHRAEVHSNDGDFARFPGLRGHNPAPTPHPRRVSGSATVDGTARR